MATLDHWKNIGLGVSLAIGRRAGVAIGLRSSISSMLPIHTEATDLRLVGAMNLCLDDSGLVAPTRLRTLI
jgi:hypothetical protein